jgi:serine/threonine protein kinase
MGSQMEIVKDSEGNNHIIFDESSLYDDSKMGDNLTDFEILQILNEDNNNLFVSKVRSINNHKTYAMKSIDLKTLGNDLNKCMDVLTKLQQLNNPHIIKYYKTFKDNENLYLIMEYMNNSDINGFIKAHQVLDKNIK